MKKIITLMASTLCLIFSLCIFTACNEISVESINVDTSQSKVVYYVNEDFSNDGIIITASMSDGSEKILTSNEYTIDYSKFDKTKAGIYEINIILNTDNTKTCLFNVSVIELTSVSAKAGYDNKFIHNEEVSIENINLVIIETYSNESTKEISGEQISDLYSCLDIDTSELGEGFVATVESKNSNLSCNITYDVLDKETLTISEFVMTTGPSTATWDYDDRFNIYKACDTAQFMVKYVEIPTREYTDCDVVYDFNEIEIATEPGSYKAFFRCGEKTIEYAFTLIEVVEYVLDSVSVDTTKPYISTYFVGEKVDENDIIWNISLVATYTKPDCENIISEYYPDGELTVDVTDLTKTTGKKTITIKENGNDLCSYDVQVVEYIIEDGTYLYDYGDGFYEDAFKKNGNNFAFYDLMKEEYVDGYSFSHIIRFYDELHIIYTKVIGDDTESIFINGSIDGLSDYYVKLNNNDFKVTFWMMDQKIGTFYAMGGKLSEYYADMFSNYGEAHLDNKTGTLIQNLAEFVFTKDTSVFFAYQQDATGQPFLGNYVSTDLEQESFGYVVINTDGMFIYESKDAYLSGKTCESCMEYRFEIDEDIVTLYFIFDTATIDLTMGVLETMDGFYVLDNE